MRPKNESAAGVICPFRQAGIYIALPALRGYFDAPAPKLTDEARPPAIDPLLVR